MNWWISMFQRHTGVRYRADSFSSRGHSIYQLEADQTQKNWPVWCHFVPCFLGCGSGKQWPKPRLFSLCMKIIPTPDKYVCFIRKPWNKDHDPISSGHVFTQRMSRFFFFFRVWEVFSNSAVRWQRQLIGRSCYLVASFTTHRPLGFGRFSRWVEKTSLWVLEKFWEGRFLHGHTQSKVYLKGISDNYHLLLL